MLSSSEEDEESVLDLVTDYCLVDDRNLPVSFTILPFWFDKSCKPCNVADCGAFLHGNADKRLRLVFKKVTCWNLDSEAAEPAISVFSKESGWIKLAKPRRSYETTVMTTMVTVHWLHFLRRNQKATTKDLRSYLHEVFSPLDAKPSNNDLMDNLQLIKFFASSDKILLKSELFVDFLKEKLGRKPPFIADAQNNIAAEDTMNVIDEVNEGIFYSSDDYEEETSSFDSVCAICDEGGEILWCEGSCLRSFHPFIDAGIESNCETLGYSRSQVEAMPKYLCKNCQYQQHQCFACGELGFSKKGATTGTLDSLVFRCISATCGHFYHPNCVVQLLFPENEHEAHSLAKKIFQGETFSCPAHRCHICKGIENTDATELQFALCRRCPRSYHRKCLPRTISFEASPDVMQRAWDGLLPKKRILIYCLKHKIDAELKTPLRNHIVFPEVSEKVKGMEQKIRIKLKQSASLHKEHTSGISSSFHEVQPGTYMSFHLGKGQKTNAIKEFVHKKISPISNESADFNFHKVGRIKKPNLSVPICMQHIEGRSLEHPTPITDNIIDKKISALMVEVSAKLTIEDVINERMIPSTYSYSRRYIDKIITWGKLENNIEAVKAALSILDRGGSADEAKAVCGPEILQQIVFWRNKLGAYLSPVIHGKRYTSFGRHFTKLDKLKEIVEKLQWYVQDEDMIVDFCCGSNDFSSLMKEKLNSVGKSCSYKNYDLIHPKNDFNFEKRDWMSVKLDELPDGSQIIMGLNPPFGNKAALANKFIDKALSFKPKLLILIVPKETERLDMKDLPYDLIWEDADMLSGKSFYLPGSVDVDGKQLDQWNLKPPSLSLWSRRDWTKLHMRIALRSSHLGPVVITSNDQVQATVSAQDDIHGQERGKRVALDEATGGCKRRCLENQMGKSAIGAWDNDDDDDDDMRNSDQLSA